MGLWEDFTGAVEHLVNQVVTPIGRMSEEAANNLTKIQKSFERSDLGQVTKAIAQPVSGAIESTKRLAAGDLQGAASRALGTAVNINPVAMNINASSTVKNALNSDVGNNLTGGWGRDAVEATTRSNELIGGNDLSNSDLSSIARFGTRTLAYGAAASYAASEGLGAKAVGSIKSNPLQAYAAVRLASAGQYGNIAGALVDNYLPGAGSIARDWINNPSPQQPTRSPASISAPQPMTQADGGYELYDFSQAVSDPKSKIAIAVFVFLLIGLVAKKGFKK